MTDGVPEIIASKLGISVHDVRRALDGDGTAPQAKSARGLALVCYNGVLIADVKDKKIVKR